MPFNLEKVKDEIDEVYYLTNFYLNKSRLIRLAVLLDRTRRRLKTFFLSFESYFKKGPALSKNVVNILVRAEGGIGDCVMTLPLIEKLKETLPNSDIYFSYDHKKVVDMLFQNNNLIKGFVHHKYIANRYDLVLSGCQLLSIEHFNKQKIMKLAPYFMSFIEKGLQVYERLRIFTEFVPVLDGVFANIVLKAGSKRVELSGLMCGIDVDHERQVNFFPNNDNFNVLEKFGLNDKKYITIHNGIDANTVLRGRMPTKCWPDTRWQEFVLLFKKEFPGIIVVQLGGRNSPEYNFVDISLVNKTKVEDIPYVLKNSMLHIDGESGLVHLNKHLDNTSLVMFGPTNPAYYSYKKNINITSVNCRNCMFSGKHWSTECILNRDLTNNDCMSAIKADVVFRAVAEFIKNKEVSSFSIDGGGMKAEDKDELNKCHLNSILYFYSRKSNLVKKAINRFRKKHPDIYPDANNFKIFQLFNKEFES